MKSRKYFRIVFVLCFIIFVIFSTTINAQEPLKIGVIAPLTGSTGPLGEESWKGVQIAIDEQNAKGGIQGRQIEYIIQNSPDPESAIASAEKLINEGINIIVCTYMSGISYAVAPICERSKVISWHLNASSDKITQQGFKYLFRTSALGSLEGRDMILYVNSLLPKLNLTPEEVIIAGAFEDGIYGTDILTSASKTASELGMNFAFAGTYSSKSQDLSSLMLQVKDSKPNVFLMVSYPPDAQLILREAAKLDLKVDVVIGTGSTLGGSWFLETYGPEMAESISSTNWPIEKSPPEYAPGMLKFVDMYKEKFNKERLFTCHSATAYTGMLFLWDALERTADLNDVESIRQAILATDIPEATVGCGWGCQFAPPGHELMGTNLRAGNVATQWQDGELWTVWPVSFPGREPIVPLTSSLFH